MTEAQNDKTDYYEVLNISHNAAPRDIVKAYRETKLIYQPDSLSTYSLYTDEELESLLQQIEEAYSVLGNPEQRQEYDKQFAPFLASKAQLKSKHKSILTLSTSDESTPHIQEQSNEKYSLTHISGEKLRKIRESRGIDMDTIAEQTKIAHEYLIAIETEDEASFPAPIYLKSFLKQYAVAIGLDPQVVMETYLSKWNGDKNL